LYFNPHINFTIITAKVNKPMARHLIKFFILIISACLLNVNTTVAGTFEHQNDVEITQKQLQAHPLLDLLAKVQVFSKVKSQKISHYLTANAFKLAVINVSTNLQTYQNRQITALTSQQFISLIIKANWLLLYRNIQSIVNKKQPSFL